MNIMWDLLFLNIHNPFTNERIRVYLDKDSCMSLDSKDFFVKHVNQMSKGMVIVYSAKCQFQPISSFRYCLSSYILCKNDDITLCNKSTFNRLSATLVLSLVINCCDPYVSPLIALHISLLVYRVSCEHCFPLCHYLSCFAHICSFVVNLK